MYGWMTNRYDAFSWEGDDGLDLSEAFTFMARWDGCACTLCSKQSMTQLRSKYLSAYEQ